MKTVFRDSDEVCHIFAQQTQKEGRNGSKNIFFEGKTIYSYGYSWILGYFYDNNTIFLNTEKRSKSTSTQASELKRAVRHKNVISIADNNFLEAIKNRDDKKHLLKICETYIEKLINNYQYDLINTNSNVKRAKYKDELLQKVSNVLEAVKIFEVVLSAGIHAIISEASETKDFKDLIKNLKVIKEKQEKLRQEKYEKEAKEKLALSKIAIKKWVNNKPLKPKEHNLLKYSEIIKLRLADDKENIETSLGAIFPLADALKALPLIRKLKANKKEYEGNAIKLGYYTINKIHKNGDVTAQCHFLTYKEIERLAKKLSV